MGINILMIATGLYRMLLGHTNYLIRNDMSLGWNVRGVKCTWGETYVGWNVRGVKRTWGETYVGWNVRGVKCPLGEMYRGLKSWGEMSWHPRIHHLCTQIKQTHKFKNVHAVTLLVLPSDLHSATFINSRRFWSYDIFKFYPL